MALDPFASRDRYVRFVRAQQVFQTAIASLYAAPPLQALIPDLASRERGTAIALDLADLGLPLPPVADEEPVVHVDMPTSLGWLYVAEGSALGAAFLIKAAQRLGLSERYGARHLAGHADGRAAHWRTFTTRIDDLALSAAAEDRMFDAARAAFTRFRDATEQAFAK